MGVCVVNEFHSELLSLLGNKLLTEFNARGLRPMLMRRSLIEVVMLNRGVKCDKIVMCFVADRADVFCSLLFSP